MSDIPPGNVEHPAGSGALRLDVRILTRYGEVIIDFGQFADLLAWSDSLSTEGASGSWTLRMRASLCNEELLKKIHPGMVVEAYCARNDDPLIGVVRDPSKIPRIDTTPDLPKFAIQEIKSPASVSTPVPSFSAPAGSTKLPAGDDGAFIQKLVEVSGRLGCNPEHLLTAMFYESAGTLDPGIRGPHVPGDGKAVGLIQFMPSTARGLGTTAEAMAVMSRSQQLDYVEKYFAPFKGQLTSYYKLYATIHAGNPNASPNGSDGYRTTGQAAAEGQTIYAAKARALLQKGGYTAPVNPVAVTAPQQTVQLQPQISGDVIGKAVDPVEDPYLDKCPYLLMRGIIGDYGRSVSGNETTLVVNGESYGKIYKDCFVLTDLQAPELTSVSLEVRNSTIVPLGVSLIYYRLLKEWVENFWGQSTGWEARTRPIPFPPNYLTRINNEGSAWSNLQFLAIEGFFHIFVDHTGAIVWEKLPWSSRSQSLIAGRNWEDLPLLDLPSWKIVSWNDRITEQGVTNFVRCVPTQQGISGGQNSQAGPVSLIYNMGSIRAYGGPTKREFHFPVGVSGEQYYTSDPRRKQQATLVSFVDLCALESIRWYDRPVQRVSITARGEAAWRINLRVKVTEDWHCPNAKPGEYYIAARSNQIDVTRGSWTTSLDLVRDRRTRYLGIGVGEVPIVVDEPSKALEIPKALIPKIGTKLADLRASAEPPAVKAAQDGKVASRFIQTIKLKGSNVTLGDLKQTFAPNEKGKAAISDPAYIRVPLVPDEYFFWDRFSGKIIPIGNDPIKWANEKVIPRLGEQSPIVVLTPPIAPTGIVAPTSGSAPFKPVDRIYTLSNLHDLTPYAGCWDFTLSRGGKGFFAGDQVLTEIPSPISGKITLASQWAKYGNAVEVTGSDGIRWFIGHLHSIAVQRGQTVTRGQTLGIQGYTGSVEPADENGTHMHLEIHRPGTGVDILPYTTTSPMVRDYFVFVGGGKMPALNGPSP